LKSFKEVLGENAFFRYRRPSLKSMLGITSLKKDVRQAIGLNTIARWTPSRIKQRVKQHLGIYGGPKIRTLRQFSYNKIPSPFKFLPKID
jgi:hypothetical protein